MTRLSERKHRAVRAVRSAAAFPAADVADVAGMSTKLLASTLRGLESRGRCASAAAAATVHPFREISIPSVAHRACPPGALRAAGIDSDIETAIAASGNPAGWGASLPDWHSDKPTTTIQAAGTAMGLPRFATRLAANPDEMVRAAAAYQARWSPRLAARLGADPSELVRTESLAAADAAAMVAAAACDASWGVRQAAAKHPLCPQPVLRTLAGGTGPDVRAMAVSRVDAADEWITHLSQTGNEQIRAAVARRSDCPEEILEALADDDVNIRAAVAANPNCTDDLLERLSKDGAGYVLESVAENLYCQSWLANQISMSRNGGARTAAAKHPDLPYEAIESLAEDHFEMVRAAVAARTDCDPEMLAGLASDDDHHVRTAVAANPNCENDVSEQLSGDIVNEIRAAAAANPACSYMQLTRLAGDLNFGVRLAAAAALKARRNSNIC